MRPSVIAAEVQSQNMLVRSLLRLIFEHSVAKSVADISRCNHYCTKSPYIILVDQYLCICFYQTAIKHHQIMRFAPYTSERSNGAYLITHN